MSAATTLTVRRLQVDLDTPLPRHWCGDAFRTAFFNALSMSFPAGEQLFIDTVRQGLAELAPSERERFAAEVQAFVGQEATHRHVHQRFNAHLAAQGLVNTWERRILARRRQVDALEVRNRVAVTAATEHLTAVLAEILLGHPELLEDAPERLRTLWSWHSAEETEHRSTAFDLYGALGGGTRWRVGIFNVVLRLFLVDLARQTLRNLWHDGTWWRPSTWAAGWRFCFGPAGFWTLSRPAWARYRREDFHPSQADETRSVAWLSAHADAAPPVRAPAAG
ncbi:MAG: metal-dependent hydrolase [Ideonella sp.]|nr:metal-dependent hydrolase [Ideonella sp.]